MLEMLTSAQVDVFCLELVDGNPLAVVFDADALDDALMQRFASWTNLSETVFRCRRPTRKRTIGCGSSLRHRSCRSPGTRR